ncbi:MAG: bifunctional adenosylcobinamide kinase/adenosylcobinamide-phosphate guanylyltransferase [Syntrophobacteraceae bacterium]
MSIDPVLKSPLLVLGGAKSGKSSYAESIFERFAPPFLYLATAQVLDDEMKERVSAHRLRRKDRWETIECPIMLADTLRGLAGCGRPALIDCITLWLSNLLCFSSTDPDTAVADLCDAVRAADHPLVIVSNEVGGGIVPENALARKFRDLAGSANQQLARICASVTLVTAGLPLRLK